MSSILQTLSGPLSGRGNSRNPPHEARRQLSWLNYCAENHQTCNKPWVEPFLPTRLVDVRSFPKIKLINTKGLEAKDQRYIALSYCWGPSMPDEGKTLLATLDTHERGIDLKSLPKTLRDATEVTRSLSFPFIWIDALCIIQDSQPDWEYELETMTKIYSCAYVTIAAGVTDTCQGGFLHPPPLLGHLRTRSILPNREKNSTDERWIPEFFKTPLFTRGWTLQERELSHRVIHFTREFVIFECRYHIKRYEIATAHHYSFTMPLQLSNNYILERGDWQYRAFDNEDKRTRLVVADDIPNGMNWRKVWHRLVSDYSLRNFTNQTDRLPAIAGLADGMQTRFKWTYVAGMWAENMPQELLWQREAWKSAEFTSWDRDRDVEDAEYVAPTWSWASADFPVWYNHFELGTFGDSIVKILETNIVPAGSNTKGKLASGYIKIKAKVKVLQPRSVAPPMGIQQEKLCRVYDTTEEELGSEKDDLWIYWDHASEVEDEGDVWVAVLMFREHGWRNGAGLALRKMHDGRFRRVGLAWYIGHPFVRGLEYSEIVII